ncbi:unnamed protein product [Discosporangium mesarthrocarpum]
MDRIPSVREAAWGGKIPAEFYMDPSEVTALQRPLPLYLLLPRMSFLPCMANAVAHHFGEVAPDAQRNLWLEDGHTGEPLRWHVPTGVLFDLLNRTGREASTSEDGAEDALLLPWRISVHFQGCPRSQVLPLEHEADIRRHYTNSLKQALFLQLGSSKAGMSLAKEQQTRLWGAVKNSDSRVYFEVDSILDGGQAGGPKLVPVRILRGQTPAVQLPIPPTRPNGLGIPGSGSQRLKYMKHFHGGPLLGRAGKSNIDLRDQGDGEGTVEDHQTVENAGPGPGAGAVARGETGLGGESGKAESQETPWAPGAGGKGGVSWRVFVQGIEPPLDAVVTELWDALRHPDRFLYVVVL